MPKSILLCFGSTWFSLGRFGGNDPKTDKGTQNEPIVVRGAGRELFGFGSVEGRNIPGPGVRATVTFLGVLITA
jgi:hypothetical protein